MKLILCDINKEILSLCADVDGLQVDSRDIFDIPFDTIITPGNSYAFMNGGFDLIISQKYGWEVQETLKKTWIENCEMIPVGGAVTYHINDDKRIIYAPTMQVPMNIGGTWNVYLALKAAFRQARNARAKIVVFPVFGCGCGGLSHKLFKKQLQTAINDYDRNVRFNSWQEAQAYYFNLIKE